MRRKDREVTDFNDKLAIIDKCEVLRLAMIDGDKPYMVPLNFGYEHEGGKITIYVHGAAEGKKTDVLSKNANICFEMDCSHKLVENENPAAVSYMYESVIGFGTAEILENVDEKIHGLKVLLKSMTGRDYPEINPAVAEKTAVIKISVSDFTGKKH